MTELLRGATVATRFVVEEIAGRGASGEVYRARDRETGEDVALKVIRASSPEEHFEREARVLEQLRHPGIVAYVGSGKTSDGRIWLALEWLDGETLGARLRSSPPTLSESLTLATAIARALAYAHAHDVVHRDIKPSNLFVVGGRVEDVKLIDFGIARLTKGTRITRTGLLMGTPSYMAPEQARGFSSVDARADLFSLGCVMYRCVAGVLPFAAEHVTAILAKVLFEDPKPLRAHRRDVPRELEALVARMLAKDPADRPQAAEAVLAQLARVVVDVHATSVPPPPSSLSLGHAERRFVSVVLARAADDSSSEATLVDPPRDVDASEATDVARLVDGTLAATFAGTESPIDHAAQAARFALRIARTLPSPRIVVATGRAVVEDELPIGEVLERAARLLDRAAPDVILLDVASARLLDGRFDVASSGTKHVLLGDRRTFAQARTLLGKPTPMVGRERELAMFSGLVDETIAESSPRCAVLTAAAGMGKSRLVAEVIERARETHPDALVWIASGDPMSEGSSLGVASELLRAATRAQLGESVEAHRDLLRAVMEESGAKPDESERVATALASLAAGSDDALVAPDARAHADRLRAAWDDFLRRVGGAHPVLVVVEDMHWGDLASVRLLDAAMRNLQDTPFFVLGVARPEVDERFPKLWDERSPLRLRLSDLTKKAARRLIAGALGDVDDATADAIVARAGGNAFHLEELVRAVAEGRDERMPDTLLAMVSQRLHALHTDDRRILRAASVFGDTFWERGLLALVGEGDAARLGELVRLELIVPQRASQIAGEVEYRFRHDVVREAAYAMLTDEDRSSGHALAGAWLSRAGATDARTLAEHFERGGVRDEAAACYLRAANQALLGGDVAMVLDLCARAARCHADAGAAERAHLEAEAHLWRAEFALAERAASLCFDASRPDEAAWWTAGATLVVSCLRREARERMLDVYEAMRAAPFEARIAPVRLFASSRVAVHLCAAGFFAEADEMLAAIRADLARLPSHDAATLGAARMAEGMRALCAGDIAACLDSMERAAALFDEAGDLRNACITQSNVGFCRSELGAYDAAERSLAAAAARAKRLGLFAVEYSSLHNLGYVLLRLGKLDDAERVEEDCVAALEAAGDRRIAGGSRLYLALVALERGDIAAAQRELDRAFDMLAETPPVRGFALAIQARVHLAAARPDAARRASAEASALLAALGAMEQGESLVRLVEAETLLATGDDAGARRAISSARDRLKERAARLGESVYRRSFLEAVPEHARTLALAGELLGD